MWLCPVCQEPLHYRERHDAWNNFEISPLGGIGRPLRANRSRVSRQIYCEGGHCWAAGYRPHYPLWLGEPQNDRTQKLQVAW